MTTAVAPTPPATPPALHALPDVGIHRGLLAETYHRWGGASNSRLTRLRRSPAHLLADLIAPPEDTKATRIGSAVHMAILEPDLFTAKYGRGPEGDGRAKAVQAAKAELELKHGPGFVLSAADYDCALAVRDAVHAHVGARSLLAGPGDAELSVAWDQNGVRCKARLDRTAVALAGGTLVDVKTTRDASPEAFQRSIYEYGYHRQAALYLKGAEALGIPARHFVFIAVEKEPPYAVATYRLTEGAIDAGGEEIDRLLARYAECLARGHWPGYSEKVEDIALPDWAWKKIDDALGGGA